MTATVQEQNGVFLRFSLETRTGRKRLISSLKRQLGSKSICTKCVCPISIFSRFSWIVQRGWKQEHTLPRDFGK